MKYRVARTFIAIALLTALAGGCYYGKVLCPDPPSQGPYVRVVKQYTRTDRIYNTFKTELMVWVTFRSEKFRRAYVKRYSAAFGLTPAEQAKMLADQLAAYRREMVFVLAAFTPERKNNDFDRKKSMWRVWLEDGAGRRIEPFEVKRVRKVGDKWYTYYPHLTPHMNVYVVRFKRIDPRTGRPFLTPGAKKLYFWISGLPGQIRLPLAF
jgi:hypothetical protein